jgi:hypothetical protein
MASATSLILYIILLSVISGYAWWRYEDRLRLIGAGLILIFLGLFWLHLEMVPGQILPTITGRPAQLAGWFTIICGFVLLFKRTR